MLQQYAPLRPVAGHTALAVPPGLHRGLVLLRPPSQLLLNQRLGLALFARLTSPKAQIEGVDSYRLNPDLEARSAGASTFVLLLPPLGNLENPFYGVHRRRNDRFLTARAPLRALFPEIDFAAFSFTGHLLETLNRRCPERFSVLQAQLQSLWLDRMTQVLATLPSHGVLIKLPAPHWLSRPDQALVTAHRRVLALDPAQPHAGTQTLCHALAWCLSTGLN